MKKMEKEHFKKKTRKNSVFWVFVKKTGLFCKMSFFRKIGKHYLCSEGKKGCAFSLQLSVFGKWYSFWCPFKVTKHYQKKGLQRTQGKTQNGTFGCKSAMLGFPSKRGFTICDAQKLCSAENTIFIVFSAKQLCRHERMQLEQKQKFTKNRSWLPKCKKVFFRMFLFCFLVVLFFVACVLVLVFCKKAQKGYLPAILEVFCLFCSHKRPVLRCFFSSYFVFFAFVFPFKTPFYPFAFWPSAPFWKTLIFLVAFFFFFLLFPFLLFACFFQTNFPNIPFLKSNLFSFLVVFLFFFLLFLFLFWLCMFQPFCFLLSCWLCFWCFFWFCFVFCFCLLSCFGSSL